MLCEGTWFGDRKIVMAILLVKSVCTQFAHFYRDISIFSFQYSLTSIVQLYDLLIAMLTDELPHKRHVKLTFFC